MTNPKLKNKYTPAIGIECHVQLKTRTKLFSAAGNDAREAPPNSLISHIDLGMPGALPVLNQKALELAIRASLVLGTDPQRFSRFDRKHYFYPDLPMGYQITQFYDPIIKNGSVVINVNGKPKTIGISEAHLEADAGKNTHPAGTDYSLVDLNRAGTPLLEIVSKPDLASAQEAKIYAKELYLLMKYADVSDASLYYGNMRFDVNVSVSDQPSRLGTRSETKNLNSFKSVEKAVEFEIDRQVKKLEKGERIVQETRGWNDAKQKTFSQRSKEEAHDYRYMPEPDVPPIEITKEMIEPVRKSMPVLPNEWRDKLSSLGLSNDHIDVLLEADIEDPEVDYLSIIEQQLSDRDLSRQLANWFVNIEIPLRRDGKVERTLSNSIRTKVYQSVYKMVRSDKLSSTNAKTLISQIISLGLNFDNIEKYAGEQGYLQVSDSGEIERIVKQVISDNPKAAEDIKQGEAKAIGFLVGQVMKNSLGKANPKMAQDLIKKQLGVL